MLAGPLAAFPVLCGAGHAAKGLARWRLFDPAGSPHAGRATLGRLGGRRAGSAALPEWDGEYSMTLVPSAADVDLVEVAHRELVRPARERWARAGALVFRAADAPGGGWRSDRAEGSRGRTAALPRCHVGRDHL